jgi:hypothetical protein
VSLPESGFSITLLAMFNSDRLSMIMLAVNAGVPLLFLVTIVALMFRHLMLAN